MRLRFNLVEAELATELGDNPATDTTIDFAAKLVAADGDVPTISAPDYLALRVGQEIMHLTAYTTGATTGTVLRAQEGTSAAVHAAEAAVKHVPTTQDFGVVIARTVYDPGSTATPGTTSTSFADVDATNLAVTFVAPPSGTVMITQAALAGVSGGSPGILEWNLREASSDVAGTGRRVLNNGTSNTFQVAAVSDTVVSGLTPGAEVTYKWGHRRAGGAGTCQTIYGGGIGAAIMTVIAVP